VRALVVTLASVPLKAGTVLSVGNCLTLQNEIQASKYGLKQVLCDFFHKEPTLLALQAIQKLVHLAILDVDIGELEKELLQTQLAQLREAS